MDMPDDLPDELELLIPDMNGIPRGKTIATSSYSDDELPHMPEAIFFQTISGNYSNELENYDPTDGDLLLKPDWSTYCPTPWREGNVGQVICETVDQSGKRIPYDPRNVLINVLDAYRAEGLSPIVAPEVELYLINPVAQGDLALTQAAGMTGAAEFGGESFSLDALDKYEPMIGDIRRMCQEMGLDLSGIVHEIGPAQIEFNMSHGEALSRADQLFMLKRLIKGCAQRQGLLASFMAKPFENLPGNGLHMHCSMLNKEGDNIFELTRDYAPPDLRYFIGGLQKYLPEAFALIAPNINSYKRFVRDLSAPINLRWGYDNRTTGLRVPFSEANAGRVESRIAGADVNPYLMMAAMLACGLLGLQQEIQPGRAVSSDANAMEPTFPDSPEEALRTLKASPELNKLLGTAFVEVYVSVKLDEFRSFDRMITQWEVGYLGSQL